MQRITQRRRKQFSKGGRIVKRATNISRRAVRGKERESLEGKRCKEKGNTWYTMKTERGRHKRNFFYYFVYSLYVENENINFVK